MYCLRVLRRKVGGQGQGKCYNQAALQPGSQQPRQGILRSDCPVWLSYPAAVSKKAVSLGDRQEQVEVVTWGQWPGFCRGRRKLCWLLRSSDRKAVGGREAAGLASPEARRTVPTHFWESKDLG